MSKGLSDNHKQPRVLIVEDDVESVELLKTLFVRKGYDVVGTANNGKAALKKYRELRPDIVTMDIMMPQTDGKVGTREILQFDPNANIVVVSVLGYDELRAIQSIGVKAFIKKPIDIEELFKAIIDISVSLVKVGDGKTIGAIGMAKALDDNFESSGLFVDILRHDLLNPLGLIKNFAELMADDVPQSFKSQAEAIARNSERLIEIVEDASNYSKLVKVKNLDTEKIEISDIINSTLKLLSSKTQKKEVGIQNNVKTGIFVEASPRLADVFYQILSNAVKYGPLGGRVIIDSNLESKEGMLIISVKDNGPGVKDAHKKAVFTRFERMKKEGVNGAGIGLSIVSKIIELHSGTIWIEDNPEGGSIFKVKIPLRKQGED